MISHRILNQFQAAHAHSVPGPMVSAPDGGILFVAEAGVLAVIDATSQDGYATTNRIVPISSYGVRAVELLLDPEADLPTEPGEPIGSTSLIYVAGGRMGLWAMRADPRAGMAMPAARIDDAVSLADLQNQTSRRWCNDVDAMFHGGTWYLLALFVQDGCSRLRVYRITDARSVLNDHPGEETTNEIWPTVEIKLGGNCTIQTPRIESFGFGLAVDEGVDATRVYVAMGPYGLVRVTFTNPANVTSYLVKDGPYFGDESYYAQQVHSLYDDFTIQSGTAATTTVHRSDPPYFMDVAIEHDEVDEKTYLWSAVDNLGILRFDVTNTAAWSTVLPINHQEGVYVQGTPRTDDRIRLVGAFNMERNYAHRMRIVETGSGPALAVAVSNRPLIFSDSLLDEGRVLAHIGNGQGGVPQVDDNGPQTGGTDEYTLLYHLPGLVARPVDPMTPPGPPGNQQHTALLDVGGRHVHLPSLQPAGELLVFGGREDAERGAHTTFRARYAWSTTTTGGQPITTLERRAEHRPGKLIYGISHSPTTRDLLYLAGNDGTLPSDGLLATCGTGFARFYAPTSLGDDDRATFGNLFNPFAIWPAPEGPTFPNVTDDDIALGYGVPEPSTDPNGNPTWKLMHIEPGANLCGTQPSLPNEEKKIFILSPPDTLTGIGRGKFSSGIVDLAYDVHVATHPQAPPDSELMIVTRQGTPAGGVVLRRLPLELALLDPNAITGDGDTVDPLTTTPVAFQRELLTHPEFEHIYDTDPAHAGFIETHLLQGRVLTFFPRLVQIPAPSGAPETHHWIAAIPSGAVQFPPPEELQNEEQPPQVYQDTYDQAMVRVFDIHDYTLITNEDGILPTYTLIGPRKKTNAFIIEPLHWQERDFLIVADFGGTVMVWEVTSLLDPSTPQVIHPGLAPSVYGSFMIAEWLATPSITDDIQNNVWGLAVDHAVWHDPGGSRDEVYIYAAVSRVGIEVLRFLPGNPTGQRLELVYHIETPSGMAGLRIRQEADPDQRTLLVGESLAGLRALVY